MLKPANGEGRQSPLASMTSGPTPRYVYGKPTEKAQNGKPPELGYDIANYGLPMIDVQTQRRNFPGYGETQYVTMADLVDNTGDSSGTTETDSVTDSKGSKGYTKINQRLSGKQKSRWNTKRS